jgi:hypothetical protein
VTWRRVRAWQNVLAAVLLATTVAYGRALPNFFTSDDLDMLAGDASDLFSPASGFGRFMPLPAVVHRAVAVASGLDPLPAHALQLALHLASAVLVYAIVWRLVDPAGGRQARLVAVTAATLFALYPRHHQVVMWFGAVSIGLASTLVLAATLAFLRAWRYADSRAGWVAVALYAAALVSHESAVALPALLAAVAAYEWSQGRRPLARRAPTWLVAAVGVLVLHLGLLAWAYRVRAAVHPDSGYRFIGLGPDLLGGPLHYAATGLVPPLWTEALAGGSVGLAFGGLALLAGAVCFWRGGALVRLGLAWGVLAAAPFILFGVYGVTDRYYYVPSVGLALAVAAALVPWRRALAALLAVYALASLVLLAQVGDEWRAAGTTTRAIVTDLADWARTERAGQRAPEAVLFVAAPFKRGERWPGSQVYVFSTGLVGAAHLATGWPELKVSYVFQDEYPALTPHIAGLAERRGPTGLHLFALDSGTLVDLTDRVGSALGALPTLRWHGASRTPVDWSRYTAAPCWLRRLGAGARRGLA